MTAILLLEGNLLNKTNTIISKTDDFPEPFGEVKPIIKFFLNFLK